MKHRLSGEQSRRLFDLGVSSSNASACEHFAEIINGKTAQYRYAPVFTMGDIFNILPRKIAFGNRSNCRLKVQAVISTEDAITEVWQACYLHTSRKVDAEADELIDALFSLLEKVLILNQKKIIKIQ